MKISPYAVGALLYAPANQENLARRVIQGQMDAPYSLALCLEDSISDCAVPEAEARAVQTLDEIARAFTVRFCLSGCVIPTRFPLCGQDWARDGRF